AALDHAQTASAKPRPVVLLSPQGAPMTQSTAEHLARTPGFILVCGRYEGLDERFVTERVDYEISLGDVVLRGGEPAAFVIIDAVARLLDGVVGNEASVVLESFQDGTLEHPHFTRPFDLAGDEVPEILRSGDHAKVEQWRRKVGLLRTRERRPDLWAELELSRSDRRLLEDDRVVVDPRWYESSRSQGVDRKAPAIEKRAGDAATKKHD